MSTLKVNAVTDGSGGNTATINSMTPTADSLQGFRNRIINGDMRIDQRNAGAAVTVASTGTFVVDRWEGVEDSDGVATAEQVQDVPSGFTDSIKWTTTTADASLSAAQFCRIGQVIEGYNTADFGWGSASAKTITLSFWVRSSLTGTFAGGLRNSAGDRSYVFTYSISAANTWEQKTVTVAGDTSGTWLTNNGRGVWLIFDLGSGSNFQKTANAWGAGNCWSTSGAVSVIGTLNATWYITGVQLEVGSVATPFERRDYGRELAMCERYFQVINSAVAIATGTTDVRCSFNFRTYMRTQPTVSETGVYNANYPGVGSITQSSVSVGVETGDDAAYGLLADFGNFTGLTAQRVYMFRPNVDGNRITFSAEL